MEAHMVLQVAHHGTGVGEGSDNSTPSGIRNHQYLVGIGLYAALWILPVVP